VKILKWILVSSTAAYIVFFALANKEVVIINLPLAPFSLEMPLFLFFFVIIIYAHICVYLRLPVDFTGYLFV